MVEFLGHFVTDILTGIVQWLAEHSMQDGMFVFVPVAGFIKFDPLEFIRRAVTLPKRYNSLSDIARDPLGALANAAQWVVPVALGVPGGFQALLTNPGAALSSWNLQTLGSNLGKVFSAESLTKAAPVIAAGASAYGAIQQQKALQAQQALLDTEAKRAAAQAQQASAAAAFQSNRPITAGTSAANIERDLLTLAASAMPIQPPMQWQPTADLKTLLGLTDDDLRELIRRQRNG